MNLIDRRSALKGLAGILLAGAAPFYVPAKALMRVKPIVVPERPLIVGECFIQWSRDGIIVGESRLKACGNILSEEKPVKAFLIPEPRVDTGIAKDGTIYTWTYS